MTDNQYIQWLEGEAEYAFERLRTAKIRDDQRLYWTGRQQAYENSIEKYKQLTDKK